MEKLKLIALRILGVCLAFVGLLVSITSIFVPTDLNEAHLTISEPRRFYKSGSASLTDTYILYVKGKNDKFKIFDMPGNDSSISGLTMDSEVTIYYRKLINGSYDIYQLEQNGKVLYHIDDYERRKRKMGIFMLVATILISVIAIYSSDIKLRFFN
jgi:hypothetical protein